MATKVVLACSQDAVRGDHGEVAQLLINHGAKIFKTAENRLVDLKQSVLAGWALSGPHVTLLMCACRILRSHC